MKRLLLFFMIFCSIGLLYAKTESEDFISPGGRINMVVSDRQNVSYKLFFDGRNIMDGVCLSLIHNGKPSVTKTGQANIKEYIERYEVPMGEQSVIETSFTQVVYPCEVDGAVGKLEIRLYDNAMAYRIDIPQKGMVKFNDEFCINDDNAIFWAPNEERPHFGPLSFGQLSGKKYFSPLLCQGKGFAIMFHEAGVGRGGQILFSKGDKDNSLKVVSDSFESVKNAVSSWRVVSFAEKEYELYEARKIFWGLNDPAKGDFSWVAPGMALWDWRVFGMKYDDFTYAADTRTAMRLIDYAAAMNLEYLLMDAFWCKAGEGKPLEPAEGLDLATVIEYAKEKGIGIWLYYDLAYVGRNNAAEIDFDVVARTFSELGAVGIKYGFLGIKGPEKFSGERKVYETLDKIETAAKYKLMIDFHDSPIPFSGLERTWPNYISREYCHAQMDRRKAVSPGYFVKSAYINLFAGAMDQANGVYALNQVKNRVRGPLDDINSTIAAENARFLITHTGQFTTLPDAPEEYKKKADAFAFIEAMPVSWDESRMIDGQFPSFVTMARRTGSKWFVGTVFDEKGGSHILQLDFLEKGKIYKAAIVCDAPETHYINNRESYSVIRKQCVVGDSIMLESAPGGGYAILFEPIN